MAFGIVDLEGLSPKCKGILGNFIKSETYHILPREEENQDGEERAFIINKYVTYKNLTKFRLMNLLSFSFKTNVKMFSATLRFQLRKKIFTKPQNAGPFQTKKTCTLCSLIFKITETLEHYELCQALLTNI